MFLDAFTRMVAPVKEIPGLVSRGFSLLRPKNPPAQGVEYDAYEEDEESTGRQVVLHTKQEPDALLQTNSWIDIVKTWVGGFVGVVGSPILAIILGYGNGYLFNGFKDIDLTQPLSVVVFCGGYLMEFIGVALLYRASQAIQNKERQMFLVTILFGLLLMSVSWLSQYTLLENEFAKGVVTFPDASLEAMPLIGGVITGFGLHGHDAMFIVRAAIFHLGELACVFLIPVKKMDVHRTVALTMERTMAHIQMDSASAMQGIMEQTFGLANQMMQNITISASENAHRTLVEGQQRAVEIQEIHTAIADVQPIPRPLQRVIVPTVEEQTPTPQPVIHVVKKNIVPEASAFIVAAPEIQPVGEVPAPQPLVQSSPENGGKQAVIAQWGWDRDYTGLVRLVRKPEKAAAVLYTQTYGEIPPSFTVEEIDQWR